MATRKFYRDAYGAKAALWKGSKGYGLLVTCMGKRIIAKTYATERGAKIAMGKVGDCWKEA